MNAHKNSEQSNLLGLQAASQIAEAASNNAFDDEYSSPYTAEAKKQGIDLPWWQKVSGARIKDGKVQLARLQVCTVDMQL